MIREKVEQTLIETAEVCQNMNVPLRCLYIQLSDPFKDIIPIDYLSVIEMVQAYFQVHEIDAVGYIAEDGDLFFLSRAMNGKMLEGMIKNFPQKVSDSPEKIMHLYEMQVNASEVINLCVKKIKTRTEKKLHTNKH